MKKIALFAATCGALVGATAFAQSAHAEGWNGCYAGGDIGAAWNSTRVTDEVDSSIVIGSLSNSAISGGGRLGCDVQVAGPVVVGISGGFDWTGLKSSVNSDVLNPLTLTGKVSSVATIDARVGYLFTPRTLGYAKAGLAMTRTSAVLSDSGTVVDAVGFSQNGAHFGAGLEQRIRSNFSLFAEYNYYDASDKTVTFPNATAIGVVRQHNQAVSVGFNYRFWHY